jgi:hypothetical protein
MAFYFLNPDGLKKADAELFGLVQQMLQVANQLGGVNPELEKSHLTHLASTQGQLQTALKAARDTPDAARADLIGASKQLHQVRVDALKQTGLDTARQVLQFGILAGAVDAVLLHVLGTTAESASVAHLQNATSLEPIAQSHHASEVGQQVAFGKPKVDEEFQEAYLAGAALAYKMIDQGPRDSTT